MTSPVTLGAVDRPLTAVVEEFLGALQRRDISSAQHVLHPQVVMRGTVGGLDEQRVMTGPDQVISYFQEIGDVWSEIDLQSDGVLETPDGRVVLLMRETARNDRVGVELTDETAIVFELEDGRIKEFRGYLDRDAALAAAGVTAS